MRTVLPLLTLAAICLIPARVAHSEEQPLPTLVNEKEKPFSVVFKDGREAVLKISKVDSPPFAFPFEISDNNCSNRQNMKCQYRVTIRQVRLDMVWSKHPDPAKINTLLKAYYSDTDTSGSEFTLSTVDTGSSLDKPTSLNAGLPAQELECSDFSWLPGSPKEAPQKLFISRWDDEVTGTNPETGVNENRTEGGPMGMQLERIDSKRLKLVRMEYFNSRYRSRELPMQQLVSSITLTKDDGEICQVGISSNFPELFSPVEKKMREAPRDLSQTPAYVVGTDGTLERPEIVQNMKYWNFRQGENHFR